MLLRATVEHSVEAARAGAKAGARGSNGSRSSRSSRGSRGSRGAGGLVLGCRLCGAFCGAFLQGPVQNVRPEGQSPFAKFFQVLQHPTAHGIQIHGSAELDEFGDAAELLHLASTSSNKLRHMQDCGSFSSGLLACGLEWSSDVFCQNRNAERSSRPPAPLRKGACLDKGYTL